MFKCSKQFSEEKKESLKKKKKTHTHEKVEFGELPVGIQQ